MSRLDQDIFNRSMNHHDGKSRIDATNEVSVARTWAKAMTPRVSNSTVEGYIEKAGRDYEYAFAIKGPACSSVSTGVTVQSRHSAHSAACS